MNNDHIKELYDTDAALYVLSCLMRKPLLLQDEKYIFNEKDFDKPLHQIVFAAIYNMAQQGVEHLVPKDVDLYIHQFGSQYAYYEQNKGFEFVNQCYQITENSDEKQFDIYYNRCKKFSLLRDLERAGIDTTCFYDTKDILARDKEDEKFNKLTTKEIINSIRSQLVSIENRHVGKDEGTSQSATEGLRNLVNELKQNPEVGLPLDGQIINWATRGARLGKLYIYSAPSGSGKSRHMVGNACALSLPYIDNNGNVVIRGAADGSDYQKVLFVATEMSADEIQTLILAYVSGVNESHILLGNYAPGEEEKIRLALDIIDKFGNNFIIECIPDPSIAMVKARLIKYIVQDGVEYIFYDYIFTSPGLITEFAAADVKEYVALMMLSNTLKEVAMSYKVFIESATQLNENWSKIETGGRDQNCLRGSKAIADKIDIGVIGVRLRDKELEEVKPTINEFKATMPTEFVNEPNIVMDVYKNRRGEMNNIKIFRYFDYGTCRCKDLFATDTGYKAIKDIGKLQYDEKAYSIDELFSKGVIEKHD